MSAYTDAVAQGLKGLQAVSTGACPRCEACMEHDGIEDPEAHDKACERGETCSDSHFSWRPCGICGSRLGGDRERWHAIAGEPGDDLKGREIFHFEILHFDNSCTDCVMYLAFGTEPELWS